MADRYDDRYRGREHDRGMFDRASDEVRSWFGDDEAERRRRHDQMRERSGYRETLGREYGGERWSRSQPYESLDEGRVQYDRSGATYRGWNEPNYGYRPSAGFGRSDWSTTGWQSDDTQRGSRGPRGYYEDSRGRLHVFDEEERDAPRYRTGPYAGLGPKNYRRSDERITEEVCDRLADSPYIDASDIEVAVKGGEVTISGSVHSRHEKRDAEDLIESISGVRDVHNVLRVQRWQPSEAPLGVNQASATPTATPPGRR